MTDLATVQRGEERLACLSIQPSSEDEPVFKSGPSAPTKVAQEAWPCLVGSIGPKSKLIQCLKPDTAHEQLRAKPKADVDELAKPMMKCAKLRSLTFPGDTQRFSVSKCLPDLPMKPGVS